jgi:hypothetical protein
VLQPIFRAVEISQALFLEMCCNVQFKRQSQVGRSFSLPARRKERRERFRDSHLGHNLDVTVKSLPGTASYGILGVIAERHEFLLAIENKTHSQLLGEARLGHPLACGSARETEIASDLRIEIHEFRWACQCGNH